MIVYDLDVDRPQRAFRPFEANPPLVIDTNAVLTLAVTIEGLQLIAGDGGQIPQAGRRLQPIKPTLGLSREPRELLYPIAPRTIMYDLILNYALRKA
jgi:hypothetical protein